MPRFLLPFLLLACVALAACGGGDDEATTSSPTSTAATAAPEVSASATTAPSPAASSTASATASATPAPGASKTPTPAPTSSPDPLAGMTLEAKVGQLIFAGVPGLTVGADARHLVNDLYIGNIVLMGDNDGTPAQVEAFTSALQQLAIAKSGIGMLIATDQEGGLVQRLRTGFTRLPDARVIGEAGDPTYAAAYGQLIGSEMRAVGVNIPFGPVLDVNDNPDNPVIGRRAFGTDTDSVVAVAMPVIAGMQSAGVSAVGKHFPGHGNTETDSHFTLPVVKKSRAELEATELAPFRAAIAQGIGAIMIAHVSYPALDPSGLPASLSKPIVTGLLRGELGFDGVTITDDLAMEGVLELMPSEQAAVQSVNAGIDMVICVSLPCDPAKTHAALVAAVRSGALPQARLDEAVRRVVGLKAALQVGMSVGDLSVVGSADHRALVDTLIAAAGE